MFGGVSSLTRRIVPGGSVTSFPSVAIIVTPPCSLTLIAKTESATCMSCDKDAPFRSPEIKAQLFATIWATYGFLFSSGAEACSPAEGD